MATFNTLKSWYNSNHPGEPAGESVTVSSTIVCPSDQWLHPTGIFTLLSFGAISSTTGAVTAYPLQLIRTRFILKHQILLRGWCLTGIFFLIGYRPMAGHDGMVFG